MAITEFTAALNQVASERNIKPEEVLETLREALIAAFRKDNDEITDEEAEDLIAEISDETGEVKILRKGKDVTPAGFGRIASQTAKQVILQKIREAEKRSIADEYRELLETITQGYIFRIDKDTVIMDIGKTQGILPVSEQIPNERYMVNQKYKVLIKEVTDEDSPMGSTIILSRRDPAFIRKLFEQEVPEMEKETVIMESIAREAGERTKVAVSSSDPKIDPSGACIGQRGIRVQAVTDELNGEKIDIINYSPDADKFIAAALSPAHVIDVILNVEEKTALVKVAEDQLSLAIGNRGQNARLAAKLTGWGINIDGSEVEASPESTPEDFKDVKMPAPVVKDGAKQIEEKEAEKVKEEEEKEENEETPDQTEKGNEKVEKTDEKTEKAEETKVAPEEVGKTPTDSSDDSTDDSTDDPTDDADDSNDDDQDDNKGKLVEDESK